MEEERRWGWRGRKGKGMEVEILRDRAGKGEMMAVVCSRGIGDRGFLLRKERSGLTAVVSFGR